jgi:hypothetical protein
MSRTRRHTGRRRGWLAVALALLAAGGCARSLWSTTAGSVRQEFGEFRDSLQPDPDSSLPFYHSDKARAIDGHFSGP